MRTLLLPWFPFVLAACATTPKAPAGGAGWEGFFELARIEPGALAKKGIGVDRTLLESLEPRVVRLILAGGEQEAPPDALDRAFAQYCANAEDRAWNEDRCAGIEARTCDGDRCRYPHFGSCTAFVLGGGHAITAAHCVAPLVEDPENLARSKMLVPGPDGTVAGAQPIQVLALGKHDFAHDFVSTENAEAMDVAVLAFSGTELPVHPIAPTPPPGSLVFVMGYPRVEGRAPEAMDAAGYRAVPGRLSASFGTVDDDNPDGRPFCSTDGRQEGWTLTAPCPVEAPPPDGELMWRGPISTANFTTTMDTINGYSGAPVFDAEGRLVGINSTVAGGINPQERYDARLRAVVTRADRVLPMVRR